ncbi:lipid droplet-associated protein [Blastococcus sp. TML/M2B]|uniref:lipid droplet-associated protein n=1 Tax=unclassified Blastococcus TaxID=2619396 RepID=UPI00190D86A8|nr:MULTISPECIES: lipid droplet-associated protein [unclassified Blastococcus]MBN1091647.1 lipid droplet-associated protein [Blastococcus sp. TML/M2B]MBN1094796.1 lipid droplet-associated protein [Blastococcus sp. TML/C7B]
MAREIPEVVRAAAGLAATVVDEARKLPETLPGLPVRVVGMAMQHAMKVQQQYAGLVARGDELFTGIRGEAEPGLATFDDDGDAAPAQGFRGSAFDRADVVPDEVPDVVGAQDSVETFLEEAPETEEILDELAVDEAIEAAPTLEETAPTTGDAPDAPDEDELAIELPVAGAADTESVPTSVDVLDADGSGIATVEATVTDEGIAAPAPEDYAGSADDGTEIARGDGPIAAATGLAAGVDTGDEAPIAAGATVEAPADADSSGAPTEAPVDGYDSFSVAQLRGRLRGYALSTVSDLVAYEEAHQGREPYLRMLRNRLEKLEEQAVEASPLAPRGA